MDGDDGGGGTRSVDFPGVLEVWVSRVSRRKCQKFSKVQLRGSRDSRKAK